jgi:hypothetical protein
MSHQVLADSRNRHVRRRSGSPGRLPQACFHPVVMGDLLQGFQVVPAGQARIEVARDDQVGIEVEGADQPATIVMGDRETRPLPAQGDDARVRVVLLNVAPRLAALFCVAASGAK